MSSGISSGVPRRSVLAGCALIGMLAGCTSEGGTDQTGRAGAAVGTEGLRRRAARDSAALLARYEATAAAHPALAESLAPYRDAVAAHLAALSDSDAAGPEGAPDVPAEPGQAVSALVNAERQTADDRLRSLAEAPPELARLLASLAAAGAAHAYLLNEAHV